MSTKELRSAPTSELGYAVPAVAIGSMLWTNWADDIEHVPMLKWPQSVQVYDKMRADPQIDALLRGLTLPIRRFRWEINPNGAKQKVYTKVAEDLGLPVVGKKFAKKYKNSFRHDDHLRTSLLSLAYGHMYFEQVGRIVDGMWRLRKLAPRMPHSIAGISVARDGGLEWIQQHGEVEQKRIPIDRLVAFIFDQEGANWFGRSLLRSAYQPWLLKDRLLRVDAIRHERNGMGVPIIELPERATPSQRTEGEKLANQYKVGAASGGALPFGMKLRLVGVEGTTSDVLASIKYHDEQMARLMLQMFMNLGGGADYGSKALGDTFVKQTAKAQDSVADWYCEVMNNYMIADWVAWNFGEDEAIPTIGYKRDEDPDLSAHEIAQMVAQNVLTVDTDLENFLRDRYGLPPLTGDRPKPQDFGLPAPPGDNPPANFPPGQGTPNDNATQPPPDRPGSQPKAAKSPLETTTRFRRQLSDIEAKSGADFESIQASWEMATRNLVAAWRQYRDQQVEELVDAVRAATGWEGLGELEPSLQGLGDLEAALQGMAQSGLADALREAASQGYDLGAVEAPSMKTLAENTAKVLSRGLGAAVSRVASRSGPGEVGANAVRAWAGTLTDVYLEETLGGALTSAQNAGRFAAWESTGDEPNFYASEILDANTCPECAKVDNKTYASMSEALQDYPAGGYAFCIAGSRCRGTLVAVYE